MNKFFLLIFITFFSVSCYSVTIPGPKHFIFQVDGQEHTVYQSQPVRRDVLPAIVSYPIKPIIGANGKKTARPFQCQVTTTFSVAYPSAVNHTGSFRPSGFFPPYIWIQGGGSKPLKVEGTLDNSGKKSYVNFYLKDIQGEDARFTCAYLPKGGATTSK